MPKHEQEKPDTESEKKKAENTIESQIENRPAKTGLGQAGTLEKQSEEVHVLSEFASFRGPLPPPAMLGEYEKVNPGTAKELLGMAKKEQDHRIEWDNTALIATVRETTRGQWFGLFIATCCIGVSAFLSYNEHLLVPSILVGTSAAALVWQFIQKKQK